MTWRIAVLTDLHAAAQDPDGLAQRRGTLAVPLLKRAVAEINGVLQPDVTVLLGDLLNDGDSPQAPDLLLALRVEIDRLTSPVVVIPGNHDGDADAFYRIMPRPPAVVEVAGMRLLPFLDPEEPDYNARRTTEDLLRPQQAREGFTGPLVLLQHVPLLPPGQGASPYRVKNADAVLASLPPDGLTLAISGHYHAGDPLLRDGRRAFVVAPALCEAPFCWLVVSIDGDAVTVHERPMGE